MKITGNTYGEIFGPAMEIIDQAKADEYFKALVDRCVEKFGQTRKEAANTQRENLGYWAGYYDDETRERVERLFKCCHPVFGSISKNGPTDAREAFAAGVKAGERMRKVRL